MDRQRPVMKPEIEPQFATRSGSPRRFVLIAVGCMLWLGLVGGFLAFQWSNFSRMRQAPAARRAPNPATQRGQPPLERAPATAPITVSVGSVPPPPGPTPSELEAKARAGDAAAALQLAQMIERQSAGQGGAMKVAFEWRLRAAETGDAMAMAGVAYAYRRGLGVEPDAERAESWTKRAVTASDADRWSRIGRAFQTGVNLPRDSREAAAWYRRAAGSAGALDLGQLDTTPRAVFQARPRYPFELRRRGVGGEVVIDFLVDQDGIVQNAYPVRSTEAGFEAAAIEAVSQWRFEPGRKNGAPVITHMQVPIIFSMDESPRPAPKAMGGR
ncbi:MAG: TonB family protein [Opitutaceae bacterium]|nr:TonB family protein [Opitutaceae bacterium]